MLEEGSFRGRTADFVFMFLFGAIFMVTFSKQKKHFPDLEKACVLKRKVEKSHFCDFLLQCTGLP
jgi:hypothetical protein